MAAKRKQAKQEAARQKLKAERRANRRAEVNYGRSEPHLIEKPTILIVCEGENTEPSYFNQFRLLSATITAIGEGYNTVSLVQRAAEIAENGKYDQVWCVFDKDDFHPNDFNMAISLAERFGFGAAYSNQAFEYWIILHFEDHQGGGMHRNDYDAKLNALLKKFSLSYDGKKSKIISAEIFNLLAGPDERTGDERRILAIKRAERNFNRLDGSNPANAESSTTVFKLVSELLKYID